MFLSILHQEFYKNVIYDLDDFTILTPLVPLSNSLILRQRFIHCLRGGRIEREVVTPLRRPVIMKERSAERDASLLSIILPSPANVRGEVIAL
jgi:hypothetical protein